jgi:hypothetical protein
MYCPRSVGLSRGMGWAGVRGIGLRLSEALGTEMGKGWVGLGGGGGRGCLI